jgi:hypothetical protein
MARGVGQHDFPGAARYGSCEAATIHHRGAGQRRQGRRAMSPHEIVTQYLTRKADALVVFDKTFFERTLHADFVYVNIRGSRMDKARYISQFSNMGSTKFIRQEIRDLELGGFREAVVATMKVHDTFENSGARSSHIFHAMGVFQLTASGCLWVAGQTMVALTGP